MGGRGSSSSVSRSFSTGDKSADKIVSAALKKYKDLKPTNKLTENIAKRELKRSPDPIGNFKAKAKQMVENHNRDLKESARFKKEIARREASIKREETLLKSYSKETRVTTDVRGNKLTANSKRYEVQANKVKMLNQSLIQAHREQRAREQSIKKFKETFASEIDRRAKSASRAYNYKKNQ